jgi:hypothetical protein
MMCIQSNQNSLRFLRYLRQKPIFENQRGAVLRQADYKKGADRPPLE